MLKNFARLLLCLTLLAPAAARAPTAQRPQRADLVVTGGTVVTMDAGRRLIEDGAVAVRGGGVRDGGEKSQTQQQAREVFEHVR
jgi:hypothetical protein